MGSEQEGISGIFLNKLNYSNDSCRLLLNGDEPIYPENETFKNKGLQINLKPLFESPACHDLSNLKLCPDLDNFRFLGWNCETNDYNSNLPERISQSNLIEHQAQLFDENNNDLNDIETVLNDNQAEAREVLNHDSNIIKAV